VIRAAARNAVLIRFMIMSDVLLSHLQHCADNCVSYFQP
jgi:hypothetical protein